MSVMCTEQLDIQLGPRHLIKGLDWRVERGECWFVLGQNGVGKTSLLYALAGLLKPAAGKVALDDYAIASLSGTEQARRRGLMAQHQADAFSNSVLDTVLIGRTPYRVGRSWDSQEDSAAAVAALREVGMADRIDADVLQLSGGERQRVALATLLVQAPDLLLLDEPTAHQDVRHQLAVMELIKGRSAQHAVVVTCHDINLAARYATHVLILALGRHWSGPVESVLSAEVLQQAFGTRFEEGHSAAGRHFIAY